MTILTIFNPDLSAESEWVCSVIFNDYLGIDYVTETSITNNFRLSYDNRTIELPSVFFTTASTGLLSQSYLPKTPLDIWDSQTYGLNLPLVEPFIPIIYGASQKSSVVTDDYIYIPIDIFGSAFFMLSRYEESVSHERDAHDRFPASASLAYRNDFLDRPIIDEYVEILWAAMKRLWPGLERKQRKARMLVSCDLDLPFDPACTSLYRLGKRLLGQTWREKSIGSASTKIRNHLAVRHGDYSHDPYHSAIDWIMDVNERASNQVAFYFIPEQTDEKLDNNANLDNPRMRTLMRTIHVRGHEIGFHPGYNTYKHPNAFTQSVRKLQRVMQEEEIQQSTLGGRQHYLRWKTPTTAQLWEANGLTYDTTLYYSEHAGFRCGTCHEYPMFDLANRKPLKLRQRPLVVMESTIIENTLLDCNDKKLEQMQHYKQICYQFKGNFTLLWHNSCLENQAAKDMYCKIIKQ